MKQSAKNKKTNVLIAAVLLCFMAATGLFSANFSISGAKANDSVDIVTLYFLCPDDTTFDNWCARARDKNYEEVELTGGVQFQDIYENNYTTLLDGAYGFGYVTVSRDNLAKITDFEFCLSSGEDGYYYLNVSKISILGLDAAYFDTDEREWFKDNALTERVDSYWSDDGICAEEYSLGAKDETNKTLTLSSAEELGLFAWQLNNYWEDNDEGIPDYTDWTVYLDADIDLSGRFWYPVFMGEVTFHGNGHTIEGLIVIDANNENSGMFAELNRSIVSDIEFKNPYIYLETADHCYAGVVAGRTFGAQIRDIFINNPNVTAKKTGWGLNDIYLGGAVGYTHRSDEPYSINGVDLYMSIISGIEVNGGQIGVEGTNDWYCSVQVGGIAAVNVDSAILNSKVIETNLFFSNKEGSGKTARYVVLGGIAAYSSATDEPEGTCLLNNFAAAKIMIDEENLDIPYMIESEDYYFYIGGICGWVKNDSVVNNLYIGDLYVDDADLYYGMFGMVENELLGQYQSEAGDDEDFIEDELQYRVENNYAFLDFASADAAQVSDCKGGEYSLLEALNDITAETGGLWKAAAITDEHTGYGMNIAFTRYKTWKIDNGKFAFGNRIGSYTAGFDIMGGTGSNPRDITKFAGETIGKAPGGTWTKTGYTYDGKWYYDDGTEKEFVFGETQVVSNMTLYLKWTAAGITFNNATLTGGTYNLSGYNATVSAAVDGGAGGTITYALKSGNLPDGLTLNTDGTISGTPAKVDSFNFTITASHANGNTADATFTIIVTKANQNTPTINVSGRKQTSITLTAVSGAEYGIDNGEGGINWQDSNTFEGLVPNSEYTFYIRMKETTNLNKSDEASDKFSTIGIITGKNEDNAPTILDDILDGLFDDFEGGTLPAPAAADGFEFESWLDDNGDTITELSDWGASIELTAVWKLAAPVVVVSSEDNADGGKTLIANHAKNNGISYSYQWYVKDGDSWNAVDGATQETLNVTDSGEYQCKVTATAGSLSAFGINSANIELPDQDEPCKLPWWFWFLIGIVIGIGGILVAWHVWLKKKYQKEAA